jgi:excisionase family DNA binding protein
MMLTPDEVAKKLGLHVVSVRRMIHDGRIPASRMGTGTHARLRIDEADLKAFIDGSKTPQEPKQ